MTGAQSCCPIDGQAYLVQLGTREVTQLNPPETRQSAFTLSPDNTKLSYVRGTNLYVVDIATGHERQLTHDEHPHISNGLPDFLAAEEMHRFEGHWWLPDNETIAYCKVDESTVDESFRIEMEAHGAQTIAQRYPYAGQTNPQVSLHLHNTTTGADEELWEASELDGENSPQAYLSRVTPDGSGLLVQTQDRTQQTLGLARYDLTDKQVATVAGRNLRDLD